jgi:cytochrome b561
LELESVYKVHTLYRKVKAAGADQPAIWSSKVIDGDRALHSGLALPVLSVGLLGLLHDSSLIPLRHPGSLHALFGALLLFFVAACFCRHVRRTPRLPPADIRAFSRRLSRTVYLLLYVLMFFDLIIGILPGTPHRVIFGQAVQFQSYLASGVLALVAIRALGALYPHIYPHIAVHHLGGAPIDAGSAKRAADVA